jgi:hypothetical protein
VAAVAGEPGALVLAMFALVAGLLHLLSGASAHVRSATARVPRGIRRGVVRVAATVRSVPLPGLPGDWPARADDRLGPRSMSSSASRMFRGPKARRRPTATSGHAALPPPFARRTPTAT